MPDVAERFVVVALRRPATNTATMQPRRTIVPTTATSGMKNGRSVIATDSLSMPTNDDVMSSLVAVSDVTVMPVVGDNSVENAVEFKVVDIVVNSGNVINVVRGVVTIVVALVVVIDVAFVVAAIIVDDDGVIVVFTVVALVVVVTVVVVIKVVVENVEQGVSSQAHLPPF